MARLIRDRVPLEICITSNIRTGCCGGYAAHPVRSFFDAGALITLNSDDPEMFETSLAREYKIAQDHFGFTDAELKQLARNSFAASWLPPEKKREYLGLF
jgi:adenosine deaminase/aminodeoxyfutalosine deaminase